MSFHGCHAGAHLGHHFDTHAGVKVGLPVSVPRSGVPLRSEPYRWFVRGVGFALGLLLVLALGLALANAARIGLLIFVALVLASGLEPSTEFLRNRLPIGRGASVLVVYAIFFLVVVSRGASPYASAHECVPGRLRSGSSRRPSGRDSKPTATSLSRRLAPAATVAQVACRA